MIADEVAVVTSQPEIPQGCPVFVLEQGNEMSRTVETQDAQPDEITAIEYFWRPGCPFCARLGSGLKAAGIPMNERNIWDKPEYAEIVRAVAGGNETVPTVIVGTVSMVNPSVKQVQEAMAEHAPHLL